MRKIEEVVVRFLALAVPVVFLIILVWVNGWHAGLLPKPGFLAGELSEVSSVVWEILTFGYLAFLLYLYFEHRKHQQIMAMLDPKNLAAHVAKEAGLSSDKQQALEELLTSAMNDRPEERK